ADRFRHFLGLALAKADTPALVADHHKCRKAETLAALHRLGDTIDRDEAVGEFRVFLALATVIATLAAVFSLCHQAFLAWWRAKAPLEPILVPGDLRPWPGSSGWRCRHPHSSELQPTFAGSIGQRLDLPVEQE